MAVKVTYDQMTDFQATLSRIKVRLDRLEDSFFSSDFEEVMNHFGFKELVEMGPKIIPFVIKRATRQGFNKLILILLRELSKGEYTPKDLAAPQPWKYYQDIAIALEWYCASSYYTEDPYYGLIDYDKE